MKVSEVRKKYLDFFKSKPRSHKEISPAPLVPRDDPSTLFTSSGMQQLVPYLMGEKHPEGVRLVNSQPCIRLQDIDEVGDDRHTTYFEMLGNWSLGDYFKKEQLPWFWEFLTKELGLPKERLYVSISKGGRGISKDTESEKVWKKIGVSSERIYSYPVTQENWWSRSGLPDDMPPGEIGGPDSEVFFEFPDVKHSTKFGKDCHPACDCGHYLEIGNSVFIQYKKEKDGSFSELPQKNIDFGGGLERMTAAVNDYSDIFKIDTLSELVNQIEDVARKSYQENKKQMQIIADHMRVSSELIKEGVLPENKMQGYVLRRMIRRSAIKMGRLKDDFKADDMAFGLEEKSSRVIQEEVERFKKTLDRGLKEVAKIKKIDGKQAFDLYQTYGFPLEVTAELFEEKGQKVDIVQFEKEFEKHKKLSRTASAGMFRGGLADSSEEVTRFHTATHLLHAALRKTLGDHVAQKGSNITSERLRFDFTHTEKLSEGELSKVEGLINQKIKENLPVSHKTMTLKQAKKEGVLALFGDKYDEKVKVYTIGNAKNPFSKEACGGPHVDKTGKIGRVRIKKQEKIGAGLVRVYIVFNS